MFHIVPKMMDLYVQVLRSRSVLVDARHLQGSAVIFKDMAMNPGLGRINRETATFHFLQELHY